MKLPWQGNKGHHAPELEYEAVFVDFGTAEVNGKEINLEEKLEAVPLGNGFYRLPFGLYSEDGTTIFETGQVVEPVPDATRGFRPTLKP